MESQLPISSFTKQLCQDLIRWMQEEESQEASTPPNYETRLKKIGESIGQLKRKLKAYAFAGPEEEIEFFKNHFPQLLSQQIYAREQMDLNCIGRIPSQRLRKELLTIKYERIDLFFKENAEFIRYYYSRSTYLDEAYFLCRNNDELRIKPNQQDGEDLAYCPAHATIVASLLAYSIILVDLERLLETNKQWSEDPKGLQDQPQLTWTDSKLGLVELIYCLKEQGAFNGGQADIKTITHFFEKVFAVQLGSRHT